MISTAELLLSRLGGPTQADLRRAISTIYYALFANLSKCCADLFVGETPQAVRRPAWMQAYRSLEHRLVFARCGDSEVMSDFTEPAILDFAYQFRLLQHFRFLADYEFGFETQLSTVCDFLAGARIAITNFDRCPDAQKREFIVSVALRSQFRKARAEPRRSS